MLAFSLYEMCSNSKYIIFLLFFFSSVTYPVLGQEKSVASLNELMNSSFSLLNDGNHQEALTGFLKVAEQTERQLTDTEHQVYVCSQSMAALCFQHLRQYEAAFRIAEQVLEEGRLSESEKPDFLHFFVFDGYMTALSYMNKSNHRYADARALFTRILPHADDDMRNRILSKIPMAWYFDGVQFMDTQHYEQALPCMEKALMGFHEIDDTEAERDASYQMGCIRQNLSDWQGALAAYQRAEALSQDDGSRMEFLVKEWKVCDMITDDETMWNISVRMDSLAAGSEDVSLKSEYYCFRGDQAKEHGQYSMAERWYLKIEQLLPNLSDAERHKYYLKLRELYLKQKDWDKALQNAILVKNELHLHRTPSETGYYLPYVSLAYIYQKQGDRIRCFQNIDSLFSSIPLAEGPRELSIIYTARAGAYSSFGDYGKALDDYRFLYQSFVDRNMENDLDCVRLLALMASMEHNLNNHSEAEFLYRKYAERINDVFGEKNSEYIDALKYLANAEAFAGHLEAAESDYMDAAFRLGNLVRNKWPYLSSAEREGYWKTGSELFLNMTPFALKAGESQSPFTEACYEGLILTKAFLLESEHSMFELIRRHGSDEDLKAYSYIQYLRARINDWERKGVEFTDSILAASTQIRITESSLSDRCRSYGDATSFMDVGYDQVRHALGPKDVLLDFTDFTSQKEGRVYAAYVVDNQQKHPLLKKMFRESSIDSLNVLYPYQYYTGQNGSLIYDLLWKPLTESVPEGSTVYYVPSHLLFQIAIESIPVGDGTLLSDHYHFIRLSSARELVRYKHTLDIGGQNRQSSAVLYGGLHYSLDDETMAEVSKNHDLPRLLALRGGNEFVRGDSLFYDLPGSMEEIEAIDTILTAAGISVVPYSGKNGTEESFLCLSGQAPAILHLATHGFYYAPDAATKVEYLRGFTDAMNLSGVVLAGGNAVWLGHELPENVLGGILTAADIARLDLSGVEMAVVSACHSGMGEATSEGLFGLQRAFKKAGVKTIVMSLWAESDIVGPEFMAAFYQNLTKDVRWDKRQAFDMAKDIIRAKYPESPSLWAGFVMLD